MIRKDQEAFPAMKKPPAIEDDDSVQEFPSFCPPTSMAPENEAQGEKFPSLYPRMKNLPQNRGFSVPTLQNGIQNNNNSSNNFHYLPENNRKISPNSSSSALPKLITLNSPSPRTTGNGSVPSSGREPYLFSSLAKPIQLKPVSLQKIIPRRRNASVLGKTNNLCTPI